MTEFLDLEDLITISALATGIDAEVRSGELTYLVGESGSGKSTAARALLGIDQKQLAEMAGLSVPTIQRMEASDGNVRGVVESLTRVVEALNAAGIELIGDGVPSPSGGRGVRLKSDP